VVTGIQTKLPPEATTELPSTVRTVELQTLYPTTGTTSIKFTTEISEIPHTVGTTQSPTLAPAEGTTVSPLSPFEGITQAVTKAPFTAETPLGRTAETITEVFPATKSGQITHTDVTLTTIIPSTTFLVPTTKQTNRTCVADADCPPSEACRSSQCVNPCAESNNGCAHNALCTVLNHIILCICPSGHTGDATKDCQGICYSHSHTHPITQKQFTYNHMIPSCFVYMLNILILFS